MARVWDFGSAEHEWQFWRQRAQFSHLLVGGVTPPGADQQWVRIGNRRTERATGNPLEHLARTDQPVRGRCRRAWKMRDQVNGAVGLSGPSQVCMKASVTMAALSAAICR